MIDNLASPAQLLMGRRLRTKQPHNYTSKGCRPKSSEKEIHIEGMPEAVLWQRLLAVT